MRLVQTRLGGTLAAATLAVLVFALWQSNTLEVYGDIYDGGLTYVFPDEEVFDPTPIEVGPAADDDEEECGPCGEQLAGDDGDDGGNAAGMAHGVVQIPSGIGMVGAISTSPS